MHPVLFTAIPLLAAFMAVPLMRIFKKGMLPTAMLILSASFAAAMLPSVLETPISELIVIAAPLGINFYAGPASILLILVVSLFGILLTSSKELRVHFDKNSAANVLTLLHFAGVFGILLSGDLFNIFVFLEITAISAYALTALSDTTASIEASIKYLLAGSIASIFLLIGIAFIYYHTGTLNLAQLSELAPAIPVAAKAVIIGTILLALAVEAELFPLNLWVPDVYEGSGSALSGLFSSMTIKATLYLLFRVMMVLGIDQTMINLLVGVGVVSMIIGELGALKQTNAVRMLAYSSVAQAGLIVAGFFGGAESAAIFAMISHSAIKAGLFLIIAFAGLSGSVESLAGIGRKNKFIGISFTILVLSLLGLPPFAGFASKFLILSALNESMGIGMVILVLLASLVEAWYLLKLVALVWRDTDSVTVKPVPAIVLIVPLIFTIGAGIYPKAVLSVTDQAAKDITNTAVYRSIVLPKAATCEPTVPTCVGAKTCAHPCQSEISNGGVQ